MKNLFYYFCFMFVCLWTIGGIVVTGVLMTMALHDNNTLAGALGIVFIFGCLGMVKLCAHVRDLLDDLD